MGPSPELMSRLNAALEEPQGLTHSGTAPGRAYSKPVTVPKTTQPSAKPRVVKRGRMGILAGGAASLVLASVMVMSMPHMSLPEWADPVVITDGPQTGPPSGNSVDPRGYQAIFDALRIGECMVDGYYSCVMHTTETGRVMDAESNPSAPMPGPTVGGDLSSTATSPASGTNTQVAGIDEGDIVKTDGSNLFIARGRSVAVLTGEGSTAHQVSTIDVSGLVSGDELFAGPVVDMMINNNTLVVLLHTFNVDFSNWGRGSATWLSMEASGLKAAFYDISDPLRPRYLSEVSQSGTYVTSRLSNGVLYLISRYYVQGEVDPQDPVTYVPRVTDAEGGGILTPEDVHIMPLVSEPTYSLVTAINLDTRKAVGEKAILGRADTIYMSYDNLFLASYNWYNWWYGEAESDEVSIPGYDEQYRGSWTDIVRMGLNGGNLEVEGTGRVPGGILNQFSLDEMDGYLRVVTTVGQSLRSWKLTAGLWVLDSSLTIVGSLPELVSNETVRSVRFDGRVAYVVTFEQTDPLFTIDLTNPTAPEVRSALKIPGFSSYLHPFGDGLLLGIGVAGDESGLTSGLKLSMFDISDPYDVREIATTWIDADETEVSNDHKAAYVDVSTGTIGFPTVTYKHDKNYHMLWEYRIHSWNGTSFDRGRTITLGDSIVYNDGTLAARGVRIADAFYIVTSDSVAVYSVHGYSHLADVQLS